MKRLVVLLIPALVAAVPLGGAYAKTESSDASVRAVCHRTSSSSRPYVKLRVTARQQRAHLRHAADIVPAPSGACPRTVLSATTGGTAFRIALTGEAETPAGDPVGTGEAVVRVRRNQGQVCFSLEVRDITLPSAGAHIHRGGSGDAGPIVVPLRTPGESGEVRGCVAASRAVVAQILASPGNYYVNVHTSDFPAGAVRGQLTGTSNDAFGWIATLQMNGANECNSSGTCNLGDPDGAGTAALRIRRDAALVCYRLRVQSIQLPAVGAHIHRGGSRSSGPIVVPMTNPDASGVSSGCASATQALIDEILASPAGFYVNVHTRDFPAGAVRAQLG